MHRSLTAAAAVAAALALVALAADPPAKPADAPAPAAAPVGRLPLHYKQLGLSAEQKAAVEKVTGAASAEVHDLEARIDAIREKERSDGLALLTDAQKKQLAQLATGETQPPAPPTPPPAKPE